MASEKVETIEDPVNISPRLKEIADRWEKATEKAAGNYCAGMAKWTGLSKEELKPTCDIFAKEIRGKKQNYIKGILALAGRHE